MAENYVDSGTDSSGQTTQEPTAPMPSLQTLTGINPPDKLSMTGNAAENWKIWKQRWNNYVIVAGLTAQSPSYKIALFLHCIGEDALRIYNAFKFDNAIDRNNLEMIIKKFDEYTIGELNETYERYIFNSRNQKQNESIDAYVTCLRTLGKTCNFCDCIKDSILRDRIVLGVQDRRLRKRLLQERNLDLKKCIDLCKSAEAANTQLKSITNTGVEDVHNVTHKNKGAADRPRGEKQDRNSRRSCNFCGTHHPFKKELCPAWKARCSNCNGYNHWRSKCTKPKIHGLRDQQPDGSQSDSDIEFISGITVKPETVHIVSQSKASQKYQKEIHAELMIADKTATFQIDCGASVNIIPNTLIDQTTTIERTNKTLQMWNHTEIKPVGMSRVILQNPKNKKYSIEFIIVKENFTPLIGAKAAQQMQLITVNTDNFTASKAPRSKGAAVTSVRAHDELVQRFKDVFNRKLGSFPGTVHLEIDKHATPVASQPRRVPQALKDKLKQELNRLHDLGVLEPVDKPTPWVSAFAVATKKNGDLRICIDPKPLNTALKRERYQLPVLDDLLPELSKARVFSTVDLRSGYWHCILDNESSHLTTFTTPYGRYRWVRLPFGLSASSEIFQKRVNGMLEGLMGVINIVDDILVYGIGNTAEEANIDHDKNLQGLLDRCREKGIALNPDKLKLRRKEVTFMGHVLTDKGITIDPEKAKAVKDMPKPTSVEDVQRINGFVNYLSRFLPNLSDHMEPIRRLTHKGATWQWTKTEEDAFQKVKQLVTEAPVLTYFDPAKELEVQCDASQKGLGAALIQDGKPVAYASRSLTETETRYAQIEREMLAIVFALEKFHQYTYARPVRVQSDHKPLESILKKPLAQAPRRIQGMMMRLQQYDIDVRYEKGTNLHIADLLSRASLPTTHHPTGADFEAVNMIKFLPISDDRINEIKQATSNDESLQTLKLIIQQGWPTERRDMPPQAVPYFNVRDELSVQNGLIFRGQRVVILTTFVMISNSNYMPHTLELSHVFAELESVCIGLACQLRSRN